MVLGTAFFVVAIAVVLIWVVIEMKRLKHKIIAILLIGLVIFTYVSFTITLKNEDVDLKSTSGIIRAAKLYYAWLGNVFTNAKSITAYASQQDWKSVDEEKLNKTTKLEKTIEDADEIWSKL